jgi:hypothetical protein
MKLHIEKLLLTWSWYTTRFWNYHHFHNRIGWTLYSDKWIQLNSCTHFLKINFNIILPSTLSLSAIPTNIIHSFLSHILWLQAPITFSSLILLYCSVLAVLVRLLNTLLCLLHYFIYDSTSRRYNPSLQSVLTPWCLVSGQYLMSSPFEGWLLTDWLLVVTCNWSDYSLMVVATTQQPTASFAVEILLSWLDPLRLFSGCRDARVNRYIWGPKIRHLSVRFMLNRNDLVTPKMPNG